MKSLICLMVLPLIACEAPFEERKALPEGEAGAMEMPAGTGGSAAGSENNGGKAGALQGKGGSDSGMAGADDEPTTGGSSGSGTGGSGNAGMPSTTGGTAGTPNGTGGSGVAGMGVGGSGIAGAPAAGMGGTDSPAAGTGGTDSSGGTSAGTGGDPINDCDPSGREGTWDGPNWNWNVVQNAECNNQVNRLGKSVLALTPPANCSWEFDVTSEDSWAGCRFTNTLSCEAMGALKAFTVKVSSSFVNTEGQLSGTIYFQDDSACAVLLTPSGMLSFSAQRY